MRGKKPPEVLASSLIGTAEAAEILDVSLETVRALACDGELPWQMSVGRYYFFRNDVQELAAVLSRHRPRVF